MRARPAAFSASFALALVACNTGSGGGSANGRIGQPCLATGACYGDLTCSGGICVAGSSSGGGSGSGGGSSSGGVGDDASSGTIPVPWSATDTRLLPLEAGRVWHYEQQDDPEAGPPRSFDWQLDLSETTTSLATGYRCWLDSSEEFFIPWGGSCQTISLAGPNGAPPREMIISETSSQCSPFLVASSMSGDVYASWQRDSGNWTLGNGKLECWRQTWSAPWTADYYVFCRGLGQVAFNHDYTGQRNARLTGTNFTGTMALSGP